MLRFSRSTGPTIKESMVMLNRTIVSLLTVLMSATSSASVMTFGSYSHDDTTDIVVGDGLEWLQWDRTVGWSVDYATTQLDAIEGGGWQIASNAQMQSLFTNYFPTTAWDADESTTQQISTGIQLGVEAGAAWSFVQMLGDTYSAAGYSYDYGEGGVEHAAAWFGLDRDADGYVNAALVGDDYALPDGTVRNGSFVLERDRARSSAINGRVGVALVRRSMASTVPEPGVIALLGLGLAGLGLTRRKARRV
ncbi:MAG: PEP-CTERM sorting domain-containing protein [Halieaceae bacterium]|nr:PEP-CTERM sorting domain-containing protein [Halieaceae bacterium]